MAALGLPSGSSQGQRRGLSLCTLSLLGGEGWGTSKEWTCLVTGQPVGASNPGVLVFSAAPKLPSGPSQSFGGQWPCNERSEASQKSPFPCMVASGRKALPSPEWGFHF